MLYSEFLNRTCFNKQELLAMAEGNLVTNPPAKGIARLPLPPFLMFDRITSFERGNRNGKIIAEQDIRLDAWFFQCHFKGDPVQPGCLGVDALWQLLGFYITASGVEGSGRALGCKEIEFYGQIRPFDKTVRYELDVRRFSIYKESGAGIAIADGRVYTDDVQIYTLTGLKVGVFKNIAYGDYPNPDSVFARGGLMDRNG